jgi:hypothetical protein
MNKIIIALISLALIAAPALATVTPTPTTDVRTALTGNGQTWVSGYASVAGKDWSEGGSMQVTGVIEDYLHNVGNVNLQNEITGSGEWNLQDGMLIDGSGTTEIDKAVYWWTEDSHTTNGGTIMKWPTETHIFTGFYTPIKIVETQVDNIADRTNEGPTGEFSHSGFLQNINTNENFHYVQGVGINMPTDCTPLAPHTFPLPVCPNCAT